MTIKELIEALESVENKDKGVYIYNLNDDRLQSLEHYQIDFNIKDRLDFNID